MANWTKFKARLALVNGLENNLEAGHIESYAVWIEGFDTEHATEWVLEHLQNYTLKDLAKLFPLPSEFDCMILLLDAELKGYQSEPYGEWDEEIKVISVQYVTYESER